MDDLLPLIEDVDQTKSFVQRAYCTAFDQRALEDLEQKANLPYQRFHHLYSAFFLELEHVNK